METDFKLRVQLIEKSWMTTLPYSSDIFNRLNDLNLNLQGETINQFSMDDKIKALIKKLEIIYNNVSNEHLQTFSNLEQFVTEHEFQVENDLIKNIKFHCQKLKRTFEEYFKDYFKFFWIRNPFIF